ncbi:hypothetical protein NL676_020395 [Syzygium grande]|nr:hypothetical protein NL676_020395 [Syzygium grande]
MSFETLEPLLEFLNIVIGTKTILSEDNLFVGKYDGQPRNRVGGELPGQLVTSKHCQANWILWEDKELLLVHEFMPKVTLKNHLFGRGSPLNHFHGSQELKIAYRISQVLVFLHQLDRHIICRDLKPSNMLLDSRYNAKISDFGLARKHPDKDGSHVTKLVIETRDYAAPEYIATGYMMGFPNCLG